MSMPQKARHKSVEKMSQITGEHCSPLHIWNIKNGTVQLDLNSSAFLSVRLYRLNSLCYILVTVSIGNEHRLELRRCSVNAALKHMTVVSAVAFRVASPCLIVAFHSLVIEKYRHKRATAIHVQTLSPYGILYHSRLFVKLLIEVWYAFYLPDSFYSCRHCAWVSRQRACLIYRA